MIWATLEIGKLSSDFNSESITGNETFNIVCHILKSYMEFLMKALQQAENKGLKTNGTTTSKREKKRKETRSRLYKWQQKHKELGKKGGIPMKRKRTKLGEEKRRRRMCGGCCRTTTSPSTEVVNNTCSIFRKDKIVKTVCTDSLLNIAFFTAKLKCKRDYGACVSNMTIDLAKFMKIASERLGQWAMLEYDLSLITEGTSKGCKGFPVPCWTGVIESFKHVTNTFIAAMKVAQILPPPEHPSRKKGMYAISQLHTNLMFHFHKSYPF